MSKNKLLALLLSVVLTFSLAVPAFAAEEDIAPAPAAEASYTVPADMSGKTVIIHTNDTHGRDLEGVYSTAAVAQLKKDFEAAGAQVLLLSAGDAMQGTPLVNLSKGATGIQFLNLAGYDAIALGNHEFDWGTENLSKVLEENKPEFITLAANVLDTETKKPLFEAGWIFELEGLKVGVFGLTTPETATKTHPDKIKGTSFVAGDEMFELAQKQVDMMEKEKCDLIVALGHLGVSEETKGNRSTDLLEKVTGIDLFIDGHSHTVIDGGEKHGETLMVSTGEYLNNIGVVIYDGKTLTADLLGSTEKTVMGEDNKETTEIIPEYAGEDAEVLAAIQKVNDEVEKELSAVMGKTEVLLNGERDPGVRTQETNLGDFAADAILWAANGYLGEGVVDAALTNGGGIRASIPVGEITMKTMNTVFPFGNEVATIDVTGAELLEAMEAATYTIPEAIGAFPQVAGIEMVITTSVDYKPGELYIKADGQPSTYNAPAEIGRVEIIAVNGEVWDAEATYTIATNDFTAAGGDTYGVFVGKTVTKTGLLLDEALVNYTKEVLGGTIPAATYGTAQNRIVVIPTDVAADAWYYDAVAFNFLEGFMKGTGEGFNADGKVTRATVLQTLYNMEGKPAVEPALGDVEGKWYADAANWASSVALVAGVEFGEDAVITRAEIAQLIANYCMGKEWTVDGGMAVKEAPDYDQVPANLTEGVGYCYDAKIMTGNEKGELNPMGEVTRAEFAQVLMNLDIFAVAHIALEKAA